MERYNSMFVNPLLLVAALIIVSFNYLFRDYEDSDEDVFDKNGKLIKTNRKRRFVKREKKENRKLMRDIKKYERDSEKFHTAGIEFIKSIIFENQISSDLRLQCELRNPGFKRYYDYAFSLNPIKRRYVSYIILEKKDNDMYILSNIYLEIKNNQVVFFKKKLILRFKEFSRESIKDIQKWYNIKKSSDVNFVINEQQKVAKIINFLTENLDKSSYFNETTLMIAYLNTLLEKDVQNNISSSQFISEKCDKYNQQFVKADAHKIVEEIIE